MNNSIKKLSSLLEKDIKSSDINAIYVEAIKFYDNIHISKYFVLKIKSPYDLLRFIVYVFSLKKTGDFKLGDKILNEGYFFSLIHTAGEYEVIECSDCEAEGYIRCYECDGNGYTVCPSCVDGEMTCPDCDGEGEIEDENGDYVGCENCDRIGEVECDNCDGNGREECSNCSGTGSSDCDECNGSGEIETDDFTYNLNLCFYWKRNLFSYLLDCNELDNPVSEVNTFFEKNEGILILDNEYFTNSEELKNNILYCDTIFKDPNNLYFEHKNKISFKSDFEGYIEKLINNLN